MRNPKLTQLSYFLTHVEKKYKPNEANKLNLPRISKIDFSGNIHLKQGVITNTDMLLVEKNQLVISGINVAKGAISVYEDNYPALTTIHYSVYEFDEKKLHIPYFKLLCQSKLFALSLVDLKSGGIKTEIKAKHLLAAKIPILTEIEDQILLCNLIEERLKQIEKFEEIYSKSVDQVKLMQEACFSKVYELSVEKNSSLVNLEEILDKKLQNGFSPSTTDLDLPIKSFSLASTSKGFFDFEHTKNIDITKEQAEKYLLKERDILIQRGNSQYFVGVSAVFPSTEGKFIFPDLMIRIKPKDKIDSYYLHAMLMSNNVRSYYRENSKGTNDTMKKINQGLINKTQIPIINYPDQLKIVEKIQSFKKSHLKISSEVFNSYAKIKFLKKSLLDKFFI